MKKTALQAVFFVVLSLLIVGYELVGDPGTFGIVVLELALAAFAKLPAVHVILALTVIVGLVMPVVIVVFVIAHRGAPLASYSGHRAPLRMLCLGGFYEGSGLVSGMQ